MFIESFRTWGAYLNNNVEVVQRHLFLHVIPAYVLNSNKSMSMSVEFEKAPNGTIFHLELSNS